MKQITTILTAVTMLFFFSCSNGGKEKEETQTTDSTTAVKADTTPVFSPYNAVMVQHTVKDFDIWKTAFDGHDSVRTSYGITDEMVARGIDNDKMVYLLMKTADVQKAKDFTALPALKDVMKKAGVTSAPAFSFMNVIRDDNSTIPQKERMMVVHKVKDFDAWLKVYDSEGKAVRAENGMVDRGLARGIDDPNMVYILFAVTDMAKAKARVASEDLKKVMMDAGVEGQPQVYFFKYVN
jgi:hypothetical protein